MDADGREWGNPLRLGVDRFPPASRMCGGARERVFGKGHRPGVIPALATGQGFGPQMINPRAEGPIHRFRSGIILWICREWNRAGFWPTDGLVEGSILGQ